VTKLALDDVERDACAGEFERARGVVGAERSGALCPLWRPDGGTRRGPLPQTRATRRAVDHAEQRTDRQLRPLGQPGAELLEAPLIHADLAAAALTVADEQRAAAGVEVTLCTHGRLVGSPLDGALTKS
jgi:hypothetical protein